MSTFAELTPDSRKVVTWVLETWLQDLMNGGFKMVHTSCGDKHRMHVFETKYGWALSAKLLFVASFHDMPGETKDAFAHYDYLEWAHIRDSSNMTFKSRMLNVISWFCETTSKSGNYRIYDAITVETANDLSTLERKRRLYASLRRLLLVKEIIYCPDCSQLVRSLLGQLAWDS